jgi:hypothetical protein
MKRMIISGFAIVAITATALAFKTNAFNQGTIYCFANASAPNVVTTEGCTHAGQPASTKIDFQVVTTGGSTTNPCLAGQTPFDGSVLTACTQTNPGTTKYAATGH